MRAENPRPRRCRSLGPAAVLLLAGCDGYASAVDPAGPQAERISDLSWLLFGLGTAVVLTVIGFLAYALYRGSRREVVASGPEADRQMTRVVGGALGVTILILVGLLLYNFRVGQALASFAEPEPLTIRVVGHQWWWEVVYEDPAPDRRVTTANEIYVPVGRQVRLLTQSRDVIHSFWAPNIHGKIDLIPGYGGTTYFQVDEAGEYRGRCAEFCGLQHAKMDFRVIAVSPDSFAAWYDRELDPAPAPTDAIQQRGQEVFLTRGCVMCHTVRGTPAGSRVGPDLTHLASRSRIAAGALPNTRGHLAGWILDPQGIKPGVKMPANQLKADELQALLSYLESLR